MTQVASETISALKTSPLLLVVVVLNAGMIFSLLYVASVQKDERQTLTKYVVENCGGPRHERTEAPSRLVLSQAGVDVLSDREGCELTAYLDTVGVLTIGIGHTSAGPPTVYQGMTITMEAAHSIFRSDNRRFRAEAHPLIEVPCHQYEWDALC